MVTVKITGGPVDCFVVEGGSIPTEGSVLPVEVIGVGEGAEVVGIFVDTWIESSFDDGAGVGVTVRVNISVGERAGSVVGTSTCTLLSSESVADGAGVGGPLIIGVLVGESVQLAGGFVGGFVIVDGNGAFVGACVST